jgi:hypothetical protein
MAGLVLLVAAFIISPTGAFAGLLIVAAMLLVLGGNWTIIGIIVAGVALLVLISAINDKERFDRECEEARLRQLARHTDSSSTSRREEGQHGRDATPDPRRPSYSYPTDWLGTGGYFRIVQFHPMDNRIDMEVRVTIPHSKRYDPPATDAQIQSFRSLFGEPPDDLTFSQASAMLSCRDYANEVVDTLRAAMGDSVRLAIGRAVAAFISRQPDVLQAVVKWNERRWQSGAERSNIRATRHFLQVQAEVCRLSEEMNRHLPQK